MRFLTAPDLRLTDFTNGSLAVPGTGGCVPANDLTRAIAVFFRTEQTWDAFPRASDPGAAETFDAMIRAGLIHAADAPGQTALPGQLEPVDQTMFDLPSRILSDLRAGEIVFLGAPIDVGTTGFPGARFGPQALRAASQERYRCRLDIETGGLVGWNMPSMGGAILNGAHLSDLGDLPYVAGEPPAAYYARLQSVMATIYRAGAFPVVLGGDHSITYATVPDKVDALVHLDAHCDLAELVPGHCHHHGNFLTRLLTEKRAQRVYHYGLRDTSGWDTETMGTVARSVGDLDLPDWAAEISGKTVFVSLDVDVLDPAVLPGTGTPVAGGLSLRKLCQVLAQIASRTRPLGLDVVELCPMRDASGLSERQVIEALLCFLAVYHQIHGVGIAR